MLSIFELFFPPHKRKERESKNIQFRWWKFKWIKLKIKSFFSHCFLAASFSFDYYWPLPTPQLADPNILDSHQIFAPFSPHYSPHCVVITFETLSLFSFALIGDVDEDVFAGERTELKNKKTHKHTERVKIRFKQHNDDYAERKIFS